MEINDYQNQIRNYQDYPYELGPFTTTLGMMNALGKVCGKIQPILNDRKTEGINESTLNQIKICLGDLMYWIAGTATDLETDMDEILALNLRKHSLLKEKEIEKQNKEAWK